jgi:hypothetical protein
MKTYSEYLIQEEKKETKKETKKDRSSNRTDAMLTLVSALKNALGQYDMPTRNFIWKQINNPKGKELMEKILRNPKTYLSDSEFRKLVQTK